MPSLIINKSSEKLSKGKHIALLDLADMVFSLTSWRMLSWEATNTILMSLVDTTEDQTNHILYFRQAQ
jgi:hypothetical protein